MLMRSHRLSTIYYFFQIVYSLVEDLNNLNGICCVHLWGFFSLYYFSKAFPIKKFQLILLDAMEWKSVWLVPPNQWNTRIKFVQKLCKQKHIKAQQKSTGEITEINRKAFPQELSSTRIFCMSSRLHLFLSVSPAGWQGEGLLLPLVLWKASMHTEHWAERCRWSCLP